jgi:hypothetical protein
VKVSLLVAITPSGEVWAVDPFVLPGINYTYWVEALLPGVGSSASSPLSTVTTTTPRQLITNFKSSVTGTTSVVGPGPLSLLGARPGSYVTWTWDLTQPALLQNYEASYELVGAVPGVGPVFERFSVTTSTTFGANGQLVTTFAPVTRGVPQGMTVELCLAPYADPDRTKPLPGPDRVCQSTQVP